MIKTIITLIVAIFVVNILLFNFSEPKVYVELDSDNSTIALTCDWTSNYIMKAKIIINGEKYEFINDGTEIQDTITWIIPKKMIMENNSISISASIQYDREISACTTDVGKDFIVKYTQGKFSKTHFTVK